jgi:succinate dehydrogenase / fumarate reductase flavoprotein subunit
VPRDIAARELLRICRLGLGVDGQMQVYLDVSQLPSERRRKIESILDIYCKFTGEDPHRVPMKIFPAVHYTMGGGWVDWPAADAPDRWQRYRQMTNLPGCFNIGESDFQYHGANRLGANSLLSCIFSGLVVAGEVGRYLDQVDRGAPSEPIFAVALEEEERFKRALLARDGGENVHALHGELADLMVRYATVERRNAELQAALDAIKGLRARYERISLDDRGTLFNQTYAFAHQFSAMLDLALIIVKGALLRNESRGAHFKPHYPQRNDATWLKTTIASFDPHSDEPRISYRPVDTRHLEPSARDYTKASPPTGHGVGHEAMQLENIPKEIPLPL